eukprot:m.234142 g.234142  ORF g.234142 m.234142 type:complete len:748 (+) comp40104_c0_seq6:805-3048(+)
MAKGQQRAQQNVEIFPDRLKQLEDQLADIAAQQAAILSAQSSRMVPTKVNRPISPSSSSSGSDSEKEAEVKSLPKTVRLSKTRSARKYSSQRNPVSQSGTESRRKKITSVDQDKRRRDQIAVKKPAHSTGSSSSPAMSELIAELDQERDRRFKAEQAARKLVEHLKSMQRKVSEEQRQQESVIVKLSQLQKILHQEKDEKVKFQEEYEKQQSHIRKMNEELLLYQEQAEECKQALRDTENAAFKLETERLQEQASQNKWKQEAQMRSQATKRELELSRQSIKHYKEEVEKLQALLAAREQEHMVQMASRIDPSRPEIKGIIRLELEKEREMFSFKIKHLEEKLGQKEKAYVELEDEFRMALHIEENRFREVQVAFEKAAQDANQYRRAGQVASEKETKVTSMLTEMTTVVKEQKERIATLVKSRKEAVDDYKGRWKESEENLQRTRRENVRLAIVEEENCKLSAQIAGQESVIEGLRQERKLWGHELAQQGASLAQDRGQMEAKIANLEGELTDLRRQTERDADTILIKKKMLEDQTETIRQLKKTVTQQSEELHFADDRTTEACGELESRLTEEQDKNQELQDRVDALSERKINLKEELATTKDELERCKSTHAKLKEHWESRLEAMSELEREMERVKETFAAKVKELTDSKRRVEEECRAAVSRLHSCDDAFRKQLEGKERSHEAALIQLRKEMNEEVDATNQRVVDVEDEMRQVLTESAMERKAMESRLLKLSRAFQEVEQGLT